MPTISIEVNGLQSFRKSLHSLADEINNPPAHALHRIGEAGLEDIDQRFMTAGYNTWQPLAPETVAKKGNSFILIDSGAMFQSSRIVLTGKNSVQVDVPYGGRNHDPEVPARHQHGGKHLPQRKIIEVTPQLNKRLTDALMLWVLDMVKAFRRAM